MIAMKFSKELDGFEITDQKAQETYVWVKLQITDDQFSYRKSFAVDENDLLAMRRWIDKQIYKIKKLK